MKRASIALAIFLTACTSMQLVEVQDVDTLYFGMNRPGGVVSEAEWKTFVAEVIVPEFDGFTEWSATGHWKGNEEPSRVVQIAHLARRGNDERILRIINEYKKRFDQEAVFWVRGQGLVSP